MDMLVEIKGVIVGARLLRDLHIFAAALEWWIGTRRIANYGTKISRT